MTGPVVCDEFSDLAAAAALDALDADAGRRLEEHAARCTRCAGRLQEFREGAALLGLAVPQTVPPDALRARVLDAAHAARPSVSSARRGWRFGHGWRVSPAWGAVAASVVVSLVALGWAARLQSELTTLQNVAAADRARAARYDQVVEVLASDRLAVRRLTPVVNSLPSRGTLYLDPATGTGMLMCRDMPPVEAGHVWQLWFVRGAERVSGGMLWPDRAGNGYTLVSVPADLQSFDSVGLTEEPGNRGHGSDWPTTPRVMGSPLQPTAQ